MSEGFGSNCYVLVGGVVAVIDPGLDSRRVLDGLQGLSINALVFINTHCHFDHCGCIPKLRAEVGGDYMIHEDDSRVVEEGLDEFMLAGLFGERPFRTVVSRKLKEGDVIDLGGGMLEVLHTPGHTQGSICLYEPEGRLLFTGDTVFADGVGRTDLPGGDSRSLGESVGRLAGFCGERGVKKVYPGHGPSAGGGCVKRVRDLFF
jgi:glyoxylase-like metal-dependent hydrolase (beta-lactamase superfamily II)